MNPQGRRWTRRGLQFAAALAAVVLAGLLCSPAGERPRPEPRATGASAEKLAAAIEKLEPLHTRLGKPAYGEWLYHHKEKGQTFAEYLACGPVTPTGRRDKLYVQPLGEFKGKRKEILEKAAEFMGIYFSREVKVCDPLSLEAVPEDARRRHPDRWSRQILTTHLLDDVLLPRLPGDAAAYIGFTTSDLWP
jgi:archaemetzincin